MEQGKFVVEGQMQIGPTERFFTFVDGEILGELLVNPLPASEGADLHGRGPRARHRGEVGGIARPPFRAAVVIRN
ncbi:MAG: hypothetical protein H0T57_08090 [Rubrobacter sp.]|nr:hypothetical protein [Rubrobacter sp.]